jgi:pSer/pThr/pTyr-binding forkhead associated (FHA) protein
MARGMRNAQPDVRRSAVDLIEEVVANMKRNRESLKYSAIVPGRYTVYVHPDEHARVAGILPLLCGETERALTENLATLNRRWSRGAIRDQVHGRSFVPTDRVGDRWHIEFLPDPDAELEPGDILVDSQLALPMDSDLGVGQRTRRVVTVRREGRTTATEHIVESPTSRSSPTARLEYEDDSGRHVHDVVRPSTTIGRGGTAYPVDVRILSSADVSREHARIRMDAHGTHFLIDLSTLGTSVDGQRVARGFDVHDGNKRENGAETPLADGARIGLADTVFLVLRAVRS